MTRIQAEEALWWAEVGLAGSGQFKPKDLEPTLRHWRKVAAGDFETEVGKRRKPRPLTLAHLLVQGMGLTGTGAKHFVH